MLKDIFKFLVKATNQHGVHSPFVYQIVTQCIYAKTEKETATAIQNYRSELLKDKSTIQVNDLGSGSKKIKTHQRVVSQIAKNAGSSNKYACLLNRLVKYLKVTNALELGTSLGISSHAMVQANNIQLDTIEGCKQTLNVAKSKFEDSKVKDSIHCYQGDFSQILLKLLDTQEYDLIFFDGNHQKEPTLKYFEACLKNKHNDSVFIFDDIYWSKEMVSTWEHIKNHPEVTVTIDLFKWGMVFFRKEQQKEHFKIRF
ncbi:O-methyltransferase [Wenyingzhuangia sp. IMCC45533]